MERRIFILTWVTAISWIVAGLFYCQHLDEQFQHERQRANWGSLAERQMKQECDAGLHSSVIDCHVNKENEQYAEIAQKSLGSLGARMYAAAMWTFWVPIGILGAFFLGRWLKTGRWRATRKFGAGTMP